ncbi:hypothetical protein MFLO_02598 [Listeria floridensis FSL S10-1187]|uniref:DUF1697 domain-containing protein n=1 Tax=Listeria floridensis FSL S10-1187 TaxID=1265817 RepID=A0ABN0RHQ3_9LIST|nr:DUF1697 domain-containing protein [Listeria floridensis]EUJ33408.1 hypothetical protein MFLO_02598 [Listeria floridensis FSL S10-1187]
MKYVVLLRAINVGGHNKIKMAALKSTLFEKGFQNVTTYIQSGNIILEGAFSKTEIKQIIENILSSEYGINTRTVVLSKEDYQAVCRENPFSVPKRDERVQILFSNEWLEDKMESTADAEYRAKGYAIYVKMFTKETHKVQVEKVIRDWIKEDVTARSLKTSLKINELLE